MAMVSLRRLWNEPTDHTSRSTRHDCSLWQCAFVRSPSRFLGLMPEGYRQGVGGTAKRLWATPPAGRLVIPTMLTFGSIMAVAFCFRPPFLCRHRTSGGVQMNNDLDLQSRFESTIAFSSAPVPQRYASAYRCTIRVPSSRMKEPEPCTLSARDMAQLSERAFRISRHCSDKTRISNCMVVYRYRETHYAPLNESSPPQTVLSGVAQLVWPDRSFAVTRYRRSGYSHPKVGSSPIPGKVTLRHEAVGYS